MTTETTNQSITREQAMAICKEKADAIIDLFKDDSLTDAERTARSRALFDEFKATCKEADAAGITWESRPSEKAMLLLLGGILVMDILRPKKL